LGLLTYKIILWYNYYEKLGGIFVGKFAALQMLKLKNSMMVKEEKNRYTDFLFFLRQKRKEVKGK
jgi:hypothetical protein